MVIVVKPKYMPKGWLSAALKKSGPWAPVKVFIYLFTYLFIYLFYYFFFSYYYFFFFIFFFAMH